MVYHFRIVWRDVDWCGPLETVLEIGRPVTGWIFRIDAYIPNLTRPVIIFRYNAAVLSSVDDVWIDPVRDDPARFASPYSRPVTVANTIAAQAVAWPLRSADILDRSGH